MTSKLIPVPPKESIRPKRKQNFYEFANELYNYAVEREALKESTEFEEMNETEQTDLIHELTLLESLNRFQVTQISDY